MAWHPFIWKIKEDVGLFSLANNELVEAELSKSCMTIDDLETEFFRSIKEEYYVENPSRFWKEIHDLQPSLAWPNSQTIIVVNPDDLGDIGFRSYGETNWIERVGNMGAIEVFSTNNIQPGIMALTKHCYRDEYGILSPVICNELGRFELISDLDKTESIYAIRVHLD